MLECFRHWASASSWPRVLAVHPHPVAVVQPQDTQSDCAMIQAEIPSKQRPGSEACRRKPREDRAECRRRRRGGRDLAGVVCHGRERRRRNRNGCAHGAPTISYHASRPAVRTSTPAGLSATDPPLTGCGWLGKIGTRSEARHATLGGPGRRRSRALVNRS